MKYCIKIKDDNKFVRCKTWDSKRFSVEAIRKDGSILLQPETYYLSNLTIMSYPNNCSMIILSDLELFSSCVDLSKEILLKLFLSGGVSDIGRSTYANEFLSVIQVTVNSNRIKETLIENYGFNLISNYFSGSSGNEIFIMDLHNTAEVLERLRS